MLRAFNTEFSPAPLESPMAAFIDLTGPSSPPLANTVVLDRISSPIHDQARQRRRPSSVDSGPTLIEPGAGNSDGGERSTRPPVGPPRKRQRLDRSPLSVRAGPSNTAVAEEHHHQQRQQSHQQRLQARQQQDQREVPVIDLLEEDDPVSLVVERQQADQIRAQLEQERRAERESRADGNVDDSGGGGEEKDGAQKLSNLSCIICMETPTDLATTVCGHLFCHECLMQALHASEQQNPSRHGVRRSQCPVCRKRLNKDKDVTPLTIMKRLRPAAATSLPVP